MKRVRLDDRGSPALRRVEAIAIDRSVNTLGDSAACCLRCPDEPCVRFDPAESGGGNAINVCPVGAIQHARSETGPVIAPECVNCGLCVLRCPVGALHIGPVGEVGVAPPDPAATIPVVDDAEFFASRDEIAGHTTWADATWREVATRLANAAAGLRQDAFYPLVAHLFTAAGHPAWSPAHGDTSNRIDLILIDDVDSLPAEVKSRTESTTINVKSVQQALENRVVLDERTFFAANPTSSTLVVGFDYPAERSDVGELIDDIATSFDVKVGLISLADLYRMALRHELAGEKVPRATLAALKGRMK